MMSKIKVVYQSKGTHRHLILIVWISARNLFAISDYEAILWFCLKKCMHHPLINNFYSTVQDPTSSFLSYPHRVVRYYLRIYWSPPLIQPHATPHSPHLVIDLTPAVAVLTAQSPPRHQTLNITMEQLLGSHIIFSLSSLL